jgi:hypothetical protein
MQALLLLWLVLFLNLRLVNAGVSILGISGGSASMKDLFSSATFSVNSSLVASTSTSTSSSSTSELSRVTGQGIKIDVDAFEIGSAGGTLRVKKATSPAGEVLAYERGKAKWAVALEPETAVFSLRHSEDFRRDDDAVATAVPALKLYSADGVRQFNLQVNGFGEFTDIRFTTSTAALSSYISVCTAQRLAAQIQTPQQQTSPDQSSQQKHLTAKCADDMAKDPPHSLRKELEQMSKGV